MTNHVQKIPIEMHSKSIFYKALICVLVATLLAYYPIETYAQGFRENAWGANKAQIVKREGKPDIDKGNVLIYKQQHVAGHIAISTFFYLNPKGQLESGRYLFLDPEHEVIKQIGRSLDRKYGPTKISKNAAGDRAFNWSTKESHVIIRYDDAGFLVTYYNRPLWDKLKKEKYESLEVGL